MPKLHLRSIRPRLPRRVRRKARQASALVVLALLASCSSSPSTKHLPVAQGFDADRYLGRWYEIGRYTRSFERGLTDVIAEYSLREDGRLKVLNRGWDTASGRWKDAHGVAKFAGAEDEGHLRVSFFGPFYGDYRVIRLDPDYSVSVVTGPDYGYLWILAREPELDAETRAELEAWLPTMGFDLEQIEWVDQSRNLAQGGPDSDASTETLDH